MSFFVVTIVAGLLYANPLLASSGASPVGKGPDSCVVAFGESRRAARARAKQDVANRVGVPFTDELAQQALDSRSLVRLSLQSDPTHVSIGAITMLDGRQFTLTAQNGDQETIPFSSALRFLGASDQAERERKVRGLASIESPEVRAMIETVLQAQKDNAVVEVRYPFLTDNGFRREQVWSGRVRHIDAKEVWSNDVLGRLRFPDRIALWLDQPTGASERLTETGELVERTSFQLNVKSYMIKLTGRDAISPAQLRVLP